MAIGAVAACILCTKKIKEYLNEANSDKIFKQYLKEGLKLELGTISGALEELLENGFKGQSLCLSNKCIACQNKRKECIHCCEIAQKALPTENSDQKICLNCWNSICSRCTTCKLMRDKAIQEYLIQHLQLAVECNQKNFDSLRSYLQAILKKQSDTAQTAV